MFAVHRDIPREGTDPECQLKPPVPSGNYDNYVPNVPRSLTTNSCWPPVGQCHSCGFDAHQRTGVVCIAYTKRCNICGKPGHVEKACRRRPNTYAAQSAKCIVVSPPIHQDDPQNQTRMGTDGNQCLKETVSDTDLTGHHLVSNTQLEHTNTDEEPPARHPHRPRHGNSRRQQRRRSGVGRSKPNPAK